jgi:hypothetical protein
VLGQIHLLEHFLAASGAERGDHMLTLFDSKNQTVEITLGDKYVVESVLNPSDDVEDALDG